MRLGRKIGLGVSALAAAMMPLVLGQLPAGATPNTDQKHQSLTFITGDGRTVRCTMSGSSEHDADSDRLTVSVVVTKDGSTDASDCTSTLELRVAYKDETGSPHLSDFAAGGTVLFGLIDDHVANGITVTHQIDNLTNCDSTNPANATCGLSFQTHPK